MTPTSTTLPSVTPSRDAPSPSRARVRAGLAATAVVACLPYLALKLAWLSGSTVGLADPALLRSGVLESANAVTLGLELVAAALAVVLAGPAARRLPGPVLAVPTFVGTGLLGGILLLLPVEAAMAATGTLPAPSAGAGPDPIRGWVYAMVYGGFALLGLSLIGLMTIEARRRWVEPWGWTTRIGTWSALPVRSRRVADAVAALLAAVVVAETVVTGQARALGAHQVVGLVAGLLVAVALILVARRRPAGRSGAALLLPAYAGAAAVAMWGAYFAVLLAVPNPLRGDSPVPTGLVGVELARAAAGLAAAVVVTRLGPKPRTTSIR